MKPYIVSDKCSWTNTHCQNLKYKVIFTKNEFLLSILRLPSSCLDSQSFSLSCSRTGRATSDLGIVELKGTLRPSSPTPSPEQESSRPSQAKGHPMLVWKHAGMGLPWAWKSGCWCLVKLVVRVRNQKSSLLSRFVDICSRVCRSVCSWRARCGWKSPTSLGEKSF